MKQGTEYVFVRFSMDLFKTMDSGQWSPPIQVRLQESYDGDVVLETRPVADQSLRKLAKSFDD